MNRLGAVALVTVSAWLVACDTPQQASDPPASIRATLSGADTTGFKRAERPVTFRFPRDHGAHPEFKHEWWYFTGHLRTPDDRRFGFQFTLFRSALSAKPLQRESAWAAQQLYLAHFAITDVDNKQFLHRERFARDALQLAGAMSAPFKVWLENWQVMERGSTDARGGFDVALSVRDDNNGLQLRLANTKPAVLHGEQGLSRKSATPGNASYYYSYTRLQADGELRLQGKTYAVQGTAWFDHEWSTSALEPEQSGWDWFSLQLNDGRDLMLFRLRDRRGPRHDFISGTLVTADGHSTTLPPNAWHSQPTQSWHSGSSGVVYPGGWQVKLPAQGLHLHITPLMMNQEMNLTFRYWEGAVAVSGRAGDTPIDGQGYVELTGYR